MASYPPRNLASIVVGTDFSPCSAVAIGQAVRISRLNSSAVHLVHCIDSTAVDEMESVLPTPQPDLRQSVIRDAHKAWSDLAPRIPGAQGLTLEVVISSRVSGILSSAVQRGADLLVLGAFGTRQPEVGFGTIATACVRAAGPDVLLVRDTQPGPFKTIVAAVDFSDTSAKALSRAAMLAHQDAAQLHILHVFDAPWHRLHYRAPTPMAAPHLQQQYQTALQTKLTNFARSVTDAYPGLSIHATCFDYSQHRSGIVQYAQSVSADLIALGTRGGPNIHDFFLGSTAEKALQESHCSILAVKPA